jgi:hypothetical protein
MPSSTIPYATAIGSIGGATAGTISGLASLGALSTAGTLGTVAAAGALTAGVGAIVAIVASLFHGADPNQVPASKIEQIFEGAADNMYALVKAGILSKSEGAQGIQSFTQAAIAYEQQTASQLRDPRPFQNAINNITKVNQAELQVLMQLPDSNPSGPINFTAAKAAYYTKPNMPGWYPDAIQGAIQATDEYLKSIPRSVPQVLGNVVSGVADTLSNAVSSLFGGTSSSLSAAEQQAIASQNAQPQQNQDGSISYVNPQTGAIVATVKPGVMNSLQAAVKNNPSLVIILAVALIALKKIL